MKRNFTMKSKEEGINFSMRCVEIEPTKEERQMTWGRANGPCELLTAEQHAAADGASLIWLEVVEHLEAPVATDEELEDGPVMQEICESMLKIGGRFPVVGSMIENGEVGCRVVLEEEKHVFDAYVKAINEHSSATVESVTRFADMLVDAHFFESRIENKSKGDY